MDGAAARPGEASAYSVEQREALVPLYRTMLLIRRFEEEAARAYAQGKIGGFLHLYIGQEAVAVGAEAALRRDDYVFQTYRDHGTALARGTSARACMAELYGKDTGCSRGLGGSMHFFDASRHFFGGYGIVGGHVALAAGAAFKAKYRGEDRVSVCFLGEGAINIGGFHEAASLAGLWKLPLVLVVENNSYAMGTPFSRSSPVEDITRKAAGYGMAGDRFEGHDVLLVRDRIAQAVARARAGEGPTLVEVLTYRFRGHSMSDPGKYRTREEVEERKRFDPVPLARARLLGWGIDESRLRALEQSVEDEVADAVRFAETSAPAREDVMRACVLAERASDAGGRA
ncbi:MAG: pyruvate dehydrogenase (acetyl-transferring) E1 component subunit alpha [Myxococcota bacterium]|nr:pyruvate dehydrogenase (acetyl-transferring) E1 component subunit alpha [Myxococcota bacterium]